MTTEEVRNETLHNEATVAPVESQQTNLDQHNADSQQQNPRGERMGEQTKSDQHGAEQSGEKKTRKPYDGSNAHGVVVKNLNDFEQAKKAKARLKLRLAFLNKEYAKCVAIIQDPDKSISDKAPAVTSAKKINEDLKKLQVVVNDLKDRIPELEELVKDSVENFNPATKVEVTI
jgi:hypothetical protein